MKKMTGHNYLYIIHSREGARQLDQYYAKATFSYRQASGIQLLATLPRTFTNDMSTQRSVHFLESRGLGWATSKIFSSLKEKRQEGKVKRQNTPPCGKTETKDECAFLRGLHNKQTLHITCPPGGSHLRRLELWWSNHQQVMAIRGNNTCTVMPLDRQRGLMTLLCLHLMRSTPSPDFITWLWEQVRVISICNGSRGVGLDQDSSV